MALANLSETLESQMRLKGEYVGNHVEPNKVGYLIK